LALGLKKETADMGIIEGTEIDVIEVNWEEHSRHNSTPNFVSLPAWSLHRLMSMITAKRKCLLVRVEADLYDVLIDRIEHGIKEGYFNKEYLV
jgi:hypothetical protein